MPGESYSEALCNEINLVRSNPKDYAKYLAAHKETFLDAFVYERKNGVKIRSKEGIASKIIILSSAIIINRIFL